MIKKQTFPRFVDWVYNKWYFWLLVVLYSLWAGAEEIVNGHIMEFIGILVASIFILSILFLFGYLSARSTCKKLGHI